MFFLQKKNDKILKNQKFFRTFIPSGFGHG